MEEKEQKEHTYGKKGLKSRIKRVNKGASRRVRAVNVKNRVKLVLLGVNLCTRLMTGNLVLNFGKSDF